MPIVDVMPVRLVQVTPDETVHAAATRMNDANVGSVGVCDGSRLVGILTERDVLGLVAEGADCEAVRVRDAMRTDLVTISGDADMLAAARIMGERRIRHLPVVEGENLLGIVGIRDVLAALTERLWHAHDEEARATVQTLLDRRRG